MFALSPFYLRTDQDICPTQQDSGLLAASKGQAGDGHVSQTVAGMSNLL